MCSYLAITLGWLLICLTDLRVTTTDKRVGVRRRSARGAMPDRSIGDEDAVQSQQAGPSKQTTAPLVADRMCRNANVFPQQLIRSHFRRSE